MKKPLVLLLLAVITLSSVAAQQSSKDFEILKITPDLTTTPEYSFSFGPKNKKVQKNKYWLELEVSFSWQPKVAKPEFLDELTFNYFVLLNNKSREYPQGTLLTGSVTHVAIPQAKAMNSVMYISPRTLERFFEGKIPTSASAAVINSPCVSLKSTGTSNFFIDPSSASRRPRASAKWGGRPNGHRRSFVAG